ncbi:MAG: B12-binding domain-containing radical SAM protein [Candidatus Omnitrophica bacterium]|nr:B12-binding domain-containing radical SAM protein [Candidatus Omnitrophota bacterium]
MIDVIIANNTRPSCGGQQLVRYSAAGVILALAKKGLDVRCVDLIPDRGGRPSDMPVKNSADVCCYAVFFGNKVNAFRHMIGARRRKKAPRLIIAFGPFASAFPKEILSRGLADIVVSHDPEFVIPALLQEGGGVISWGTIPNLSYMQGKKIIHTRKHNFHDLDEIPFIGPHLYSRGHRPAFIMAARGCRHHCIFCDRNALWGGGVRNRSVANVLSEIRELVEGHHVKAFEFLDEDLAADHQRLVAICEGMRRIKGEFYWSCSACVGSVNQETLLLMGRCGCREIYFGVESASPQVLRRMGKTYACKEIINAVRWAQEAGLKVAVMIMIGTPGEGNLDRELTLSALHEIGTEVNVRVNRLVILPGTALYRKGLREGWFSQESFFEDEGLIFYDGKR